MIAMRPQARRVASIADAKSGAASWVRHKCAANLLHFGRVPGYPDLGGGGLSMLGIVARISSRIGVDP
jgi:hypothetical protein